MNAASLYIANKSQGLSFRHDETIQFKTVISDASHYLRMAYLNALWAWPDIAPALQITGTTLDYSKYPTLWFPRTDRTRYPLVRLSL